MSRGDQTGEIVNRGASWVLVIGARDVEVMLAEGD